MPRFVVLEHDHPHLHWDLMLEADGVLRTWRLAAPPERGVMVAVEALGDHRLHYLDYEGPVSGGRGKVARWDAGVYEATVSGGEIRLEFWGQRLVGTAKMRPLGREWSFTR